MSNPSAVIFGCNGSALSPEEAEFFALTRPVGFILFSRNCETPEQVSELTHQLRKCIDDDRAPILIDQEGGRVARLGPPHWRHPPAGQKFADLARHDMERAIEALTLNIRLIGQELLDLGINVDCLPVLDIPQAKADPIIGDRAYGSEPDQVAALGRVASDALIKEGVLPIIKHIPGHGRATVDSHKELPRVGTSHIELSSVDFAPFKLLADMPLAMTAHVIYEAIDPDEPATTSQKVIEEIIRDEIGFDGLLMSDDLSMKALDGSFAERTEATLAAGCDIVLHCNGKMTEMKEIASSLTKLSAKGELRLQNALALIQSSETLDKTTALERLDQILEL